MDSFSASIYQCFLCTRSVLGFLCARSVLGIGESTVNCNFLPSWATIHGGTEAIRSNFSNGVFFLGGGREHLLVS